jgi:hypothetical protein
MIPMTFATLVENMSNPLHQVVTEHLPQVEVILTFSIAVVALVLSTYNAHINRARTSRSEQIKTSRDVWVRINEKFDPIREIARKKGWSKSGRIDVPMHLVWSLVAEIDYFAYLILYGEINDKVVLDYYSGPLSHYIESIMKYYASADDRYFLSDDFRNLYGLIKKWNINIPDEET